jgi:hypothetical protein
MPGRSGRHPVSKAPYALDDAASAFSRLNASVGLSFGWITRLGELFFGVTERTAAVQQA